MKKVIFFLTYLISYLLIISEIRAQVLINEFVPDSTQEWIELYNASGSADYLKVYYVDDDPDFLSDSGSSSKKLLTNLNVNNPMFPTIDTSSFLNNSGDWVVLFNQNGELIDQYQFTTNPGKDISIGRYPDLTGNFSILVYSTKADVNSAPQTPSPTPTLSPTEISISTPTPTKTPTPTPIPTKTPLPTPVKTPLRTNSSTPIATVSAGISEVLGIRAGPSSSPSAGIEALPEKKADFPLLPIILIFAGVCFVAIPIFSIIKDGEKDYTDENEKQSSDTS